MELNTVEMFSFSLSEQPIKTETPLKITLKKNLSVKKKKTKTKNSALG